MNSNFTIRVEEPRDFREVETLTRESFWNVYHPGCTEHYVLHCFRSNPDFIPELSLVMEKNGQIIGHVMFSKAELNIEVDGKPTGEKLPIGTFGPISIHPDFKRQDHGLKLLKYALEKAKALGIGFICMEGNIDFYRHAGFDLASKLNITTASQRIQKCHTFWHRNLFPVTSMELKQLTLPQKDTSLQKKIPRTLLNTKQNFPIRKNWFCLVS